MIVQATGATTVVTPAELFDVSGSDVAEVTLAIQTRLLPGGVLALTLTTTVNVALAPEAILGFVQVIEPVAPTAGVVQFHPAGTLIDWKVVLGERV